MWVFLLTDIEGSTRLWEEEPHVMRAAIELHDQTAVEIARQYGGEWKKQRGEGDSLFLVFKDPSAAAEAAVAIQLAFRAVPWPTSRPIKVRMAIHLGYAEEGDYDFYGSCVNRCARIRSLGYGGQVLISSAVFDGLRPGHGLLTRDLGLHRLKDLLEPERVYQVSAEGLPQDFPPLKSLELSHNNIPVQTTRLIGREQEVADIRALLRRDRLITLTGTGGLGKTRLALQVAAEESDTFADGLWFVDLSALQDAGFLASQVASIIGLAEKPGDLVTQIAERLYAADVVLVLDNCEHMIDAVARFASALLSKTRRLRVIATSRQPLAVAGEQVYELPLLPIPPEEPLGPAELLEYGVARLFVERAQSQKHGFALDTTSAQHVQDICRKSEGIALAVELAAARVRTASVEDIAARMNQRLRLLTSGSRAAQPRQQTLRALIDWSYQLLSPAEQELFRRLSVFVGSFSAEAVEEICWGDGVEIWDIFDLLSELVDKSLLVQSADSEGSTRYRMLESIREFASDAFTSDELVRTLKARHFDFYLALATEAESKLSGAQQAILLARLDADQDNFRAAIANGEPAAKASLAGSLWRFWFIRGHFSLGRTMLESVLQLPLPATAIAAKAHVGAGVLAWRQQDFDVADAHYKHALELLTSEEDTAERAALLSRMGLLAFDQAQFDEARQYYAEAQSIAEGLDSSEFLLANISNNLGILEYHCGQIDAALEHYSRCFELRTRLGDRLGAADTSLNIGLLKYRTGDLEEARRRFEAVLPVFESAGSKSRIAAALENLGVVFLQSGDAASARAKLEQSLALYRQLKEHRSIREGLVQLAVCELLDGQDSRAKDLLTESLTKESGREDPQLLVELLRATAYAIRDDAHEALKLFEAAECVRSRAMLDGVPVMRPFVEAEFARLRLLPDGEQIRAEVSSWGDHDARKTVVNTLTRKEGQEH